jgi:hypothetical protein
VRAGDRASGVVVLVDHGGVAMGKVVTAA